jgi:hypothetical protein
MYDLAVRPGGWLLIALAFTPVFFALGLEVWEALIRPHLLPAADIDRLVAETMRRHPDDPERAAFREEAHHWRRSESFERGKWRRVRREIRRRVRDV